MSDLRSADGIAEPTSDGRGGWFGGRLTVGEDSAESKAVRLGSADPVHLALAKHIVRPAIVVVVLGSCMAVAGRPLNSEFAGLGLLAFLASERVFSPLDLPAGAGFSRPGRLAGRLVLEWACVVAIVVFLVIAFKLTQAFSLDSLALWAATTPVALFLAQRLSSPVARRLNAQYGTRDRCVIIGVNEVGVELARRIKQIRGTGQVMAFLDHRTADRLAILKDTPVTPGCTAADMADFVRSHAIDRVYIALPISKAPRIKELVRELRDTTASVYFVPDLFAFDLVHARCIEIDGMPAFSICESPLQGTGGVWKRLLDLGVACAALALIWPVLLVIAVLVKQSSPGPVLFKQRRYGLHGEEILVYKFRSMTACEDGAVVRQATREDSRITPIGRFLRRTSLDELPQILNVLEGKMSIVGPRPHAVAHNEEYRKLISGYMIRHKVRPGITGWAQIHGLRGETSTVERMRARIEFDLHYLKNWSLWLDVRIIARTVFTVFNDGNAY
jgi:putative colanic acid biosynthesis UDP-glucose lipid carrier transferase